MKGLITICARGGSKGIPGKNIRMLGDKPLIYYSLKVAEEFKKISDVDIFLSTDSEDIKDVVKKLKFSHVQTDYSRPEKLATDTAGKIDAIVDVMNFAETTLQKTYDFVMDLDVTAPLRTVEDLKNAYHLLFNHQEAINIFSVSPAHRNPYFNMVEETANGFYTKCKNGSFLTRQSAPKVYDMNASFYIFKKKFFEEGQSGAITDRSIIYEVPHLCFDLDNPIDFEFMEFLIDNDKLDFDFLK